MERRISEILEANARERRRVIAAIEGLPQPAADWRADDGGWSLGEVAHHLVLAEESMRTAVEKSIARHRAGKSFQPMPDDDRALTFEQLVARRRAVEREPLEAPDPVRPTRGRAVADLVLELERGAEVSCALFAEQEAETMRRLTCPHWLFGLLTLLQWMELVGAHDRDHADQMARIRAHPGFPAR